MKKLIQLTLATVFVVITVLTVNINKVDAGELIAAPCQLPPTGTCAAFGTQGTPITFTAIDGAPFTGGATVVVTGVCNLILNVPAAGGSTTDQCTPPVNGQYYVANNGPDEVTVLAQ